MSDGPDELKFEALRSEYDYLRSEVELAIRNQVRILGYGGTVTGIIAGLGVVRPSLLIAAALPFIAFFFAVLWSIEQTRMMRAGDYISTIESRLNEEYFDESVMLWENWLRYRAEEQPERDIYQIHYWAQYLVVAVFILAVTSGIVSIWLWQPNGAGNVVRGLLTLLYLSFILVISYFIVKITKHKDISKSFVSFQKNVE